MQVLGVVGATGTGTTTTTVDLAAALRREGHHAAVLDLTGDVADWFDVETEATLADVLADGAPAGRATANVELPHGDVEASLAAYAEALGRDETAFRAGDVEVETGEVEVGELPVVVGGDRSVFGDVDDETMADARADLAFAYDYIVADAGTLGPAVARLPDGIVVVTDTRENSLSTAAKGLDACRNEGLSVVGAVLNKAGDETDVSAVSERLGADILSVVPGDARTLDIEPIAFTAPESPAGFAYSRLAEGVLEWLGDGDGGGLLTDQPVVTDGNGESDDTDDGGGTEDDGGGLLGRLSDRFR
ncbi:MinD/ParA family ATP-binding protein [Halorarius litoreus]|uniref:MinD/ParA family ATP-binding protein n=1 Tax=Halorarius litoreus TaxID=2962676 RepID=UPI0020CC5C5E|nr:type IV secretion system DNA-binding domain-containing protein [Halorarius litoreus]